jgi:hypothetical protein
MKKLLILLISAASFLFSSCAEYYSATERLPDVSVEYRGPNGEVIKETFFDGKAAPIIVLPKYNDPRWTVEPAK